MARIDDILKHTTLNDLHLWLFNNGYEHIWFEFEQDLLEDEA
jgi:hypothetical protein